MGNSHCEESYHKESYPQRAGTTVIVQLNSNEKMSLPYLSSNLVNCIINVFPRLADFIDKLG